jgi:hypothetical protein
MPERESMRPLKTKTLLSITCATVICATAAAVASSALTGSASATRHVGVTARSAVHHQTDVTWTSVGARKPNFQRQWAGVPFSARPGALRQISVPFPGVLRVGGVENLRDPDGLIPGNAPHIVRNWWPDDGTCLGCVTATVRPVSAPGIRRHRHRHVAPHRRPAPHRRDRKRSTPMARVTDS